MRLRKGFPSSQWGCDRQVRMSLEHSIVSSEANAVMLGGSGMGMLTQPINLAFICVMRRRDVLATLLT
jgi:hypothetical protein